MIILGLDPSAGTTGYAISVDGVIVKAGYVTFDNVTEWDGDRYGIARSWFLALIQQWQPDRIIMEGFYFSRRHATGSSVSSEIRGVFKEAARSVGVPYRVVDPNSWKKLLTGRVYPTKAEKRKYGKEKAKKMVTYLKLESLGVSFPKKVHNPKTDRMINFKFDISDAVGILIAELMLDAVEFKVAPNLLD